MHDLSCIITVTYIKDRLIPSDIVQSETSVGSEVSSHRLPAYSSWNIYRYVKVTFIYLGGDYFVCYLHALKANGYMLSSYFNRSYFNLKTNLGGSLQLRVGLNARQDFHTDYFHTIFNS